MEIKDILNLLPKGYKEACWETKAMSRRKGIQDEETLITLCLYYAYDHSLIEVKNYAKILKLADISDVGFMKRFIRCGEWIKWILAHMSQGEVIKYEKPELLNEYRVMAIDASDITQKGAVRQSWHLHYAVNLFTMSSEIFKITTEKTGETLKNFDLRAKDLVLADRVYTSISGIEYCRNAGADFILRLRNKAFTLYDSMGNKVILSELLKEVENTCCDFMVYYKDYNNNLNPIRLCAVKKNEKEIKFTNQRIKRTESKKQLVFSEETKFTHNYFFVITSLDKNFTCKQILELYKLRWQVEMVFKRYKSILNLGSMPTKTASSSEVWLNCKMLIAVLIEKLLSEVDFSPYITQKKPLEGNEDIIPFDFNVLYENK